MNYTIAAIFASGLGIGVIFAPIKAQKEINETKSFQAVPHLSNKKKVEPESSLRSLNGNSHDSTSKNIKINNQHIEKALKKHFNISASELTKIRTTKEWADLICPIPESFSYGYTPHSVIWQTAVPISQIREVIEEISIRKGNEIISSNWDYFSRQEISELFRRWHKGNPDEAFQWALNLDRNHRTTLSSAIVHTGFSTEEIIQLRAKLLQMLQPNQHSQMWQANNQLASNLVRDGNFSKLWGFADELGDKAFPQQIINVLGSVEKGNHLTMMNQIFTRHEKTNPGEQLSASTINHLTYSWMQSSPEEFIKWANLENLKRFDQPAQLLQTIAQNGKNNLTKHVKSILIKDEELLHHYAAEVFKNVNRYNVQNQKPSLDLLKGIYNYPKEAIVNKLSTTTYHKPSDLIDTIDYLPTNTGKFEIVKAHIDKIKRFHGQWTLEGFNKHIEKASSFTSTEKEELKRIVAQTKNNK